MRASLPKSIVIGALVLVGVTGLPVRAAEPTAAGLWEQVDDNTGKPESWFKITERNGVYVGNIVRSSSSPAKTRIGFATGAKARRRARRCWAWR